MATTPNRNSKNAGILIWKLILESGVMISKIFFIKGPFEKYVLTGQLGLKEALEKTIPEIGFDGDVQALIDCWMERDSNVNQDLMPYIKKLAGAPDVSLYIATNQEHVHARYLMDDVGFGQYFEDILYAARLGALKPDIWFYEEAQKILQADKSEIVFFDDNQDVVDAANDFGWEAHQFDTSKDLFKSDRVRKLLS